MSYQEALDYLYSQLPMFHRIGAPAYKANLDNTLALSEVTGYPYKKFNCIHVAGTNGKGSVSHMTASILMQSGLKAGLFTSPHLTDFRERMKVNGEMIPEDYIAAYVEKHMDDFNRIKPSFFEMTFVMAMSWFADMKVDIAVVEAGLGGRLDSTNVITPVISVITNIGYDHMQFLGNTLQAIAGEKAGIIKPGVPVVIGEYDHETAGVFESRATENNSPLIFADQVLSASVVGDTLNGNLLVKVKDLNSIEYEVESSLTGDYQLKNITTVLVLCTIPLKLRNHTGQESTLVLKKEDILTGFKQVINNTNLEGRWQILNYKPLIVCDIGHNTHGLPWVVRQIRRQKYDNLHFVLGVVNDKDISGMLEFLPIDATYYFCKADIPRGLDASELSAVAGSKGLKGNVYYSVENAFESARSIATENDMVFIGGSAFVVAEVLALINRR